MKGSAAVSEVWHRNEGLGEGEGRNERGKERGKKGKGVGIMCREAGGVFV